MTLFRAGHATRAGQAVLGLLIARLGSTKLSPRAADLLRRAHG